MSASCRAPAAPSVSSGRSASSGRCIFCYSARPIEAERAYAIGIASELCDIDETIHRAIEFAAGAAKLPPLAIRGIKRVVTDGADLPLCEGIGLEQDAFLALFDSADKAEA